MRRGPRSQRTFSCSPPAGILVRRDDDPFEAQVLERFELALRLPADVEGPDLHAREPAVRLQEDGPTGSPNPLGVSLRAQAVGEGSDLDGPPAGRRDDFL